MLFDEIVAQDLTVKITAFDFRDMKLGRFLTSKEIGSVEKSHMDEFWIDSSFRIETKWIKWTIFLAFLLAFYVSVSVSLWLCGAVVLYLAQSFPLHSTDITLGRRVNTTKSENQKSNETSYD